MMRVFDIVERLECSEPTAALRNVLAEPWNTREAAGLCEGG